jgi:YD repeat-containing protein
MIETIHPDDTPLDANDNPRTRHEYDAVGRKTADIDEVSRITRYGYDALGRQTARVLPLGQRESFSYNAAGERSTQVHFNGHTIGASFDALGRIETLTLPEGQRHFEYSASGQIARIDDNGQIYGYTYDERDRIIQAVDPFGRAIDYEYDANGNRVALYPSDSPHPPLI